MIIYWKSKTCQAAPILPKVIKNNIRLFLKSDFYQYYLCCVILCTEAIRSHKLQDGHIGTDWKNGDTLDSL